MILIVTVFNMYKLRYKQTIKSFNLMSNVYFSVVKNKKLVDLLLLFCFNFHLIYFHCWLRFSSLYFPILRIYKG